MCIVLASLQTTNQLNQTLEEEKKMLLLQVNKLLEQVSRVCPLNMASLMHVIHIWMGVVS